MRATSLPGRIFTKGVRRSFDDIHAVHTSARHLARMGTNRASPDSDRLKDRSVALGWLGWIGQSFNVRQARNDMIGDLFEWLLKRRQPISLPGSLFDIVEAYDTEILRNSQTKLGASAVHEAQGQEIRDAEDAIRRL